MFKVKSNKIVNFFSAGHERTIAAKKNVALSFLLKGGSVAISFLLIPLTIDYVNTTDYGIWLTLSSVISWFGFFDIGLGNGLKNKLAESNALEEYSKSRAYVSTTYAALSIVSVLIFLVFLFANNYLDWSRILNIQLERNYLNSIALVVTGVFCIQFVVQLINTVLTASHEPAKVSLIALLGQLSSLGAIYLLPKFTEGNLLYLVMALAGLPLIMMLTSSVWLFKTKYRYLAPGFKSINFSYAKQLLALGGAFFFIQMGQLVLYQTDNIIIAQLFGPDEVTTFNITYKLFSSVLIVFSIVLTPFWSAFTDAYAKKDFQWIKNSFNKMKQVWLITVAVTLVLLLVSPLVFHIWLKGKVQIPIVLSCFITLSVIGSSWHMLCCYLLNGINKIRIQLIMYILCFIINIPLAIFFGQRFGLVGVVLANIVVFVFMGLVFYIQCQKILNRKATGIWNK